MISMIKIYTKFLIREYKKQDHNLVENFRSQALYENNESLSFEKYNPNNINGKTWLFFIAGNLASISVCEASHYTGDKNISARICRYHILKRYRHCNAGFHFLHLQVLWAKKNNFKVIYWTQDIKNKSLNKLYLQEKRMPGKSSFFENKLYKSFKINKDYLFKVSPKSDLLQYIYFKVLQENYLWIPKKNVIPFSKTYVDIKYDTI